MGQCLCLQSEILSTLWDSISLGTGQILSSISVKRQHTCLMLSLSTNICAFLFSFCRGPTFM